MAELSATSLACDPMNDNPLSLFLKISADEVDGKKHFTANFYSIVPEGKLCNQFKKSIASEHLYSSVLSCHELICLITQLPCYVYLCNPSTQEFVKLPYSHHFRAHATHSVGLGYLPSSNEYKIVHMFRVDLDIVCQVFTVRDGEPNSQGPWRVIGNCPYESSGRKSSVCINGAIYWLIGEDRNDTKITRILSFDLGKEEFGLVSFPESYWKDEHDLVRLIALKGSLCPVTCVKGLPKFDFWIRDHMKQTWVKEYSFDFSTLDHYIDRILYYVPLDGGEILANSKEEGLLYNNIDAKKFTKIDDSEKMNPPNAFLYFGGSFSLDSRNI